MDLYIANGTRQIQHFMYRVPEVAQVRSQTIRIGGQIKISGDLNQFEIDAIIAQHRIYGLIAAAEIDSGKGLAPLAYQVGRSITPDKIARLMARNQAILIERGRQARKDAAIVMTNNLGNSLRESGLPSELNEVEIGLTEERARGSSIDADLHGETIVVNKETPESPSPRRRRRAA